MMSRSAARRLALIHELKQQLLILPRLVAAGLVGQDREHIERLLTDHVLRLCEEYARGHA